MTENKINLSSYSDDAIEFLNSIFDYDGHFETLIGTENHIMIRYTIDGETLRLELKREGAENV